MGGACYSEMRAGYEVTSDKKNWEIVMGMKMNYELFIITCKRGFCKFPFF